jgi:hypothetical protein
MKTIAQIPDMTDKISKIFILPVHGVILQAINSNSILKDMNRITKIPSFLLFSIIFI